MSQPTLETFKRNAQAEGFDEIVERTWAPSTHNRDAHASVRG
jgi:hypothetical protein